MKVKPELGQDQIENSLINEVVLYVLYFQEYHSE